MRDFYAAELLLGSTGTPTVGALAALTELLALTRACRVRSIGGRLSVGAAPVTAGGHMEFGIVWPNGTLAPYCSEQFGVAAAGAIIGTGVPIDIVVPAGSVFYGRCEGTAAGADHALQLFISLENYTLT
jgi:hypothetical protein